MIEKIIRFTAGVAPVVIVLAFLAIPTSIFGEPMWAPLKMKLHVSLLIWEATFTPIFLCGISAIWYCNRRKWPVKYWLLFSGNVPWTENRNLEKWEEK